MQVNVNFGFSVSINSHAAFSANVLLPRQALNLSVWSVSWRVMGFHVVPS